MPHGENAMRRGNRKEWNGKGRPMKDNPAGSKRSAGKDKDVLHGIERAMSKRIIEKELRDR